MTSNIEPLQPAPPAQPVSNPMRAAGTGDFAATLGAARGALAPALDAAAESSPPPQVQAEMAAASRAWEALNDSGREVRFETNAGGRVHVALHQVSGERLAVLDLADVYALIAHERRQ